MREYPLREVTLDLQDLRVGLPKDVAGDLGWTLSDGETLVCRYMARGYQRLYRRTPELEALLEQERAAADSLDGEQRIERLLVIGDVFREITWHTKSPNRFKLDHELVVSFLGPEPAGKPLLYMQAGPSWIEWITHDVRLARLQRWEQAMALRAET